MTKALIRSAHREDIDALTQLTEQLGYPSTPQQMAKRYAILTEKPDENTVFVAELNGRVVGWVHVHIYSLLVDDPETEIGGLVVEETVRGQGIGEALMQAAEAWTVSKGCSSVYLRSNVIRARAHDFYRNIGYELVKSQYAFRKTLTETAK